MYIYSLFVIVHAHRDPGNSRQFNGASKLFAQGSIPTREKGGGKVLFYWQQSQIVYCIIRNRRRADRNRPI